MTGPAALLLAAAATAAPIAKDAMVSMLKTIDVRQRNSGDWKSQIYMEQHERDKTDTVFEALVFRRDKDAKLMILFTKPKTEAGKGYLRLDKNLWMYDPTTGKWERRTEREKIGGTDSRREDFDQSDLASQYDPADEGDGTLGAYAVHHLKLTVKAGVDVAFPVVHLWIDAASGNILKRQDFALSGRLMRTDYYPKWAKVFSGSKQADVWYPPQMRFYDEVDKANSTIILIQAIDLHPLDENIFTKAWLESKSR
jgi:outer membrane lipoprotein-sorting protein